MNGNRWMVSCLGALVAGMLWHDRVAATTRVLSATDVRTIVSSEGNTRVLLDFGSLESLDGVLITGAFLEAGLPGETPEADLEVQAYTLDTRWTDGATTWTSPWSTPGGDVNGAYSRSVTMIGGERVARLRINVTEAVRTMVRGQEPTHGFLLSVPPTSGDGFRASERAVLGTLAEATLDIRYVKLPRSERAGR